MQGTQDPPQSFELALERFVTFLAANGHEKRVEWINDEACLVDEHGHYWVRIDKAPGAEAEARYALGLNMKLGIEMRAVCMTSNELFATVYVPVDEQDAEYRLMGRCLKCSCPVQMPTATAVTGLLRWWFLKNWKRKQSKMSSWW